MAIILAAIATWLRPEVVPVHRLAFFAVTLALISAEAGGYTMILVIFFVFMEPWKGVLRPLAIVCAFILCIPSEILLSDLPSLNRYSFWSGGPAEVHFGVGLGMFLRPGLVIFIGILLSTETIHRVCQDILQNGWSSRWRYRRDWPILPSVFLPGYKKSKNHRGRRETE